MRYGKIVTLTEGVMIKGRRMVPCVCDCGTEKFVRLSHLKSGRVVSCGCHRRETAIATLTSHGKSKTRTYRIWRNMINRCYYEKGPEFLYWGGRGISVCDKWRLSFEAFNKDMGDAPDGLSIDRIANDGNYEPGNCKCSTPKEQAANRRKPSSRIQFSASPMEVMR